MVRIAVVGYGYWGPNLVRNFFETPGAKLSSVCDLSPSALEKVGRRYPGVRLTTDFEEIVTDPGVDAVVIATPVSSHADLAIRALRAGKHVLVEKPIAATSSDARCMIETAREHNRILLVDHTFVYLGAVRKLKELIDGGELGDLLYYDSVRVNLGLYQRDVSVLWDLAVHDLSIIGFCIPQLPIAVGYIGVRHIHESPEDIGYLTLMYEGNLIAHIHVNWLSPVKVRRTLIAGSKKMAVFDDLDPIEKVKIYDRGITRKDDMVGSGQIPIVYRRTGDIWIPQLEMTEPLAVETAYFVRCIEDHEQVITDGEMALRIVEILEAAERSLEHGGQLVPM